MKKRIFAIFTALVLFSLSFAASASGDLLYDGAQLLDDEEYNNVLGLLQEVSELTGASVAVFTVDSIDDYRNIEDAAIQLYEERIDDDNGILLLVAMDVREIYILSTGYCANAYTDSTHNRLVDDVIEATSKGFAYAFGIYAYNCSDTICTYLDNGGDTDTPYVPEDGEYDYDYGTGYGDEYGYDEYAAEDVPFSFIVGVAFVIGFIIALIITGVWKGQLKSVRYQSEAQQYVRSGSFNLVKSEDRFLYRNVSRREKPRDNGSSGGGVSRSGSRSVRSSSGRSYRGGGGKF